MRASGLGRKNHGWLILGYAILTVFTLWAVIPFYWMIITSFTPESRILDPEPGIPAAIDLNAGTIRWKIPFGEYPELVAKGLRNTGSDNYGGPVVTASGLLFIGATSFDRKFHAYDKLTGKLLW